MMDKIIVSLALLTGGIALITYGIIAMNSFGFDVSGFFPRSPTDKAICVLIGGTIAAIIGLVSTLRSWTQA